MSSLPRVDVVLLVYGRRKYTECCLDAIVRNTHYEGPFRLWICVQANKENTRELVQTFACEHPELVEHVWYYDTAVGITEPVNYFWTRALKNPEIAFLGKLDNDIVVHPKWLTYMVDCMLSNPEVGVVGGWVLSLTPEHVHGIGPLQGKPGRYCQGYVVPSHVGGIYLIRREVVRKVGLLDTNVGVKGYLGWAFYQNRVRRQGWKVVYSVPAAFTENLDAEWNPKSLARTEYLEYTKEMYYMKHGKPMPDSD